MVDLHRDQTDIICKLFCRGELLYFLDQLLAKFLRAKAQSLTDGFKQPSLIKILPIDPFNLEQPVSKEEQDVASGQFAGGAVVLDVFKNS